MRLFIAEKPSLGREISKYLPGTGRNGQGFISHGEDVVTWAYGHVLEQAEPGDYEERYKKWQAQDLPIIPKEWKLLVTKSSANQFEIIKGLIEKADIIVNAGDPDREGQLLIDEILTYVNNKKEVQRILLNALDEKSIKAALADLRDNRDFYNLQQSALARSRADWLIGMNLSRAFTLAAQKAGHKVTFPIGRVKTPTLALVVRREKELENFVPVDYFTIKAEYKHALGSFTAQWQPSEEQRGLDAEGRLLQRELAEEIVAKLLAQPWGKVEKREKTKKKELQRLPLSLSALQVLAGKAYGYDPQMVLDTAQKLYERKLTTYPRSDCDYLPENQYDDRLAILRNLSTCGESQVEHWAKGANTTIKSKAWNDKKITAHHAIIPTTVVCNLASLGERERNIYKLIAQAYIAQFYEVHEYEQTKITILQEGETFIARGRTILTLGWKELYRKATEAKPSQAKASEAAETNEENAEEAEQTEQSNELPLVKKGDALEGTTYEVESKSTKPPTRFTAATLLQAMKEIHKYVKNEDLKKQLKAVSGIGTEATRATIIGELISKNFLIEVGKKKILQPTETAYLLIDSLPEEMVYPDETAIWEERLALMSEGKDKLQSFLDDQERYLRNLIKKTLGENFKGSGAVKKCPQCGEGHLIKRNGKFGLFYGCSNYPKCRYTEQLQEQTPQQPSETPEKSDYKCPRCKEGYFIKETRGSRITWVCSNKSQCRTACADVEGVPSLFVNK